jgi:glycosyltransferase involved in cell wall biosynthesis
MADRLLFDSLAVKDYFIEYLSGDEYKRYAPGYIERIINKIFKLKYRAADIKEIVNKIEIIYERIDEAKFIDYDIDRDMCVNNGTNNCVNGENENLCKFKNFFNIGITGRVTEQKGQVYFVKAAELLLKSGLKSLSDKSLMFHIVEMEMTKKC